MTATNCLMKLSNSVLISERLLRLLINFRLQFILRTQGRNKCLQFTPRCFYTAC